MKKFLGPAVLLLSFGAMAFFVFSDNSIGPIAGHDATSIVDSLGVVVYDLEWSTYGKPKPMLPTSKTLVLAQAFIPKGREAIPNLADDRKRLVLAISSEGAQTPEYEQPTVVDVPKKHLSTPADSARVLELIVPEVFPDMTLLPHSVRKAWYLGQEPEEIRVVDNPKAEAEQDPFSGLNQREDEGASEDFTLQPEDSTTPKP